LQEKEENADGTTAMASGQWKRGRDKKETAALQGDPGKTAIYEQYHAIKPKNF